MGRHPGSGGLALADMATAKSTQFDKRRVLEKQRQRKLNQLSRYKRVQKRLGSESAGPGAETAAPQDNVAALEAVLGTAQPAEVQPARKKQRREQAPPGQQEPQSAPQPSSKVQPGRQVASSMSAQAAKPLVAPRPHASHPPLETVGANRASQARQDTKEPTQPSRHTQRQHDVGQPQSHAREGGAREHGRTATAAASTDGAAAKPGRPISRMQRMMAHAKQQKAEALAAKQEAECARQEDQARKQGVQKARQEQKHRFFQRTRTGQPLMRYRMEKILSQLQQDS